MVKGTEANQHNDMRCYEARASHFIVRFNRFRLNALFSYDSVKEKENIR